MAIEPTPVETFAELVEAREGAEARVAAIETEARAAHQALVHARERLVQFEQRADGKPAERRALEDELADAARTAAAPWAERAEGARRAVSAAHANMQQFAAQN